MFDIDFPGRQGRQARHHERLRPVHAGRRHHRQRARDGGQQHPARQPFRRHRPRPLDGTTYRTADGRPRTSRRTRFRSTTPSSSRAIWRTPSGRSCAPGPRQVDASVTVSQAGGSVFNLEQWNGRYHGVSPGNDNVRAVPSVGPGSRSFAIDNHACDIRGCGSLGRAGSVRPDRSAAVDHDDTAIRQR